MFVIKRFISDVVEEYRKKIRFPQMDVVGINRKSASLKLGHHIHSFVYKIEKTIIIETIQYIKDRTK